MDWLKNRDQTEPAYEARFNAYYKGLSREEKQVFVLLVLQRFELTYLHCLY